MKKCPVCGAVINENNMNRCSRFPICTYVGKMETQEIHDINEYVVFDLETSGFSRKDDRIIEIGAVYVKNGVVVDRFSQLCSPGYKNGKKVFISARITEITGIRNQDLLDKPEENVAVNDFSKWLSDLHSNSIVAIAHNGIKFDIPFLKEACKRAGAKFNFSYIIDTLEVVKSIGYVDKGILPNSKQETLANYFGIEYDAHRAVNDCEALAEIYKHLLKDCNYFTTKKI